MDMRTKPLGNGWNRVSFQLDKWVELGVLLGA